MSDVVAPLFTWRTGITESDLAATTRHVLLTISLYMNEKGESAFPSMERLAHDTGLSKRAIVTHVGEAEKAGFLEVIKQTGEGQAWRHNYYSPCLPESIVAKVEALRDKQKNRRLELMRARGERRERSEGGSPPLGKKAGEGGSPPSKKVVNLTTQGGEPNDNKVVNEVHSNTPSNTTINNARELAASEGGSGGSALTREQVEWQQLAEQHLDPLPKASQVTIADLEALTAMPSKITAKALRMQLPAVELSGVPLGLWVDWLVCREPHAKETMQQLDMVTKLASTHGASPGAVLLYSLEKYRDTSTPQNRRVPCFPSAPKASVNDPAPSFSSKRAAKSAPTRSHVG